MSNCFPKGYATLQSTFESFVGLYPQVNAYMAVISVLANLEDMLLYI